MRSAKIVSTLGPASDSEETISALAAAGMSVARLNASHGSPDTRRELVDRIRAAGRTTREPVAVMLDLPGPEIRTAAHDGEVTLEDGATVQFVEGETVSPDTVGITTDISTVEPGDRVLLDDGRIETTVEAVDGGTVTAHVDSGGALGGRAGVNVPGVDLDLPVIPDRDETELDVAVEKSVDFVAASFVRDAEDIYAISEAIKERGGNIPIVAKIERASAVENLDGIIDAAYGVMVARGDLGVELPLEDVPLIQKRIIRQCKNTGTPVITATEMLDSMVQAHRPTRAEASDVANAVLDGTDAVMLSAETAVGDHPVRVVETMNRIVGDIEDSEEYAQMQEQRVPPAGAARADAVARSARYLARDLDAAAIVVASESGYTALKTAKYRPSVPIIAASPTETVKRQLRLSWGIIPKSIPDTADTTDAIIDNAVQTALRTEAADSGDTVVVIAGKMSDVEGVNTANTLKTHVAAETVAAGRPLVDGFVTGPVHRVTESGLASLPTGAIAAVPADFEGEFDDDPGTVAGILDAHPGMTSYAALVARELDIPAISNVHLPDAVADGDIVTLDAERGIVYDGKIDRVDVPADRSRP